MNISDIYTVKDCLRNVDIRTYNCGYFPVAISRPKEIMNISGLKYDNLPLKISVTNQIISLKLYYAIQLLLTAICAFRARYSAIFRMKWIPRNESFNKLSYLDESINDEIAIFYEMLKSICSSGVIRVSEGFFFSTDYTVKNEYYNAISLSNEVSPTVNIVIDTGNVHNAYKKRDLLDAYKYERKNVCYSWEEIKEYFVTLSLKDIELLHGQEINRYCAKDDTLYKACEHLDIEGIKSSIKNGANIHAINEDGESPIYKCVEAVKYFCWDELEDLGTSELNIRILKMKECIDFLIQQGADINSYGFGCSCDPLGESIHIEDSRVIDFLLSRGANPNLNTDFEDMCNMGFEWFIKSSVLEEVSDLIGIDGIDYCKVHEQMLLSYGAQLYIDGFNPETGKMEVDGYGTESR